MEIVALGHTARLQPDYAEANYNRGLTYRAIGDTNRAIAEDNQAIQRQPDFAPAHNNRGIAYKQTGEQEKATADFKKVLELTDDAYVRQKAEEQLKALGAK